MKREYGKDFASDIKIDKYALDDENEISPSILSYYGELQAEAKTEVDKCENALKLCVAQKDLLFRTTPPVNIKITESVISSLIETDEDIIKLKEVLGKAKERAYRYYAAVDALHDKSARLHDLVDLWMKGYYTQPGN